jgi:hypothetical protein
MLKAGYKHSQYCHFVKQYQGKLFEDVKQTPNLRQTV